MQTHNTVRTVEKNYKKAVWCITGPTGIGKTSVSIKLAQALQTEIISFDSRQFYHELKIGSAAPNHKELATAKHHFIGHRSVHDEWNAAAFAEATLNKISELHQHFDTLILVGGSGLYLQGLIDGFDDIPEVDSSFRVALNADLATHGLRKLQDELGASDPDYFQKVDLQNPQRLIRALEVIRGTGRAYSSFLKSEQKKLPFEVRKIGLEMPRIKLYERINRRVGIMVAEGLIEEARALKDFRNLNALNTVGYKELFPYFDGECSLDFALEEIRKNSRRYAKRQITWFRRDTNMEWFEPKKWESILRLENEE
jgi:tRNA dimethylallyltransferase